MTYAVSSLKRLRYLSESTFGVSGSGQPNYNDIPVISADLTLGTEMLDVSILQQRKDGVEKAVTGRTRPTANFSSYLYGAPKVLSASVTPGTSHLANILGVIMGGNIAGSGGEVDGSITSGSFSFGGGEEDYFPVGSQAIWISPTTGKAESRRVAANPGGVMSFQNAYSSAPQMGDKIYNGHTVYFREDCSGSLQVQVQGAQSYDAFTATGLQGTFTLENVLGQLPTIAFALNGADWVSQSLGSLSKVDYSGSFPTAPPVFLDSEVLFYRRDSASTTYTGSNLPLQSVTITPTVNWAPVETAGGVNNLARWVRTPASVTAEITPYFTSREYLDARDNGWEYALQVTIGSQPGRMVVFCLPRVQITDVQMNDNGGIKGQKITVRALQDTVAGTSGYGELAGSLMTITFA